MFTDDINTIEIYLPLSLTASLDALKMTMREYQEIVIDKTIAPNERHIQRAKLIADCIRDSKINDRISLKFVETSRSGPSVIDQLKNDNINSVLLKNSIASAFKEMNYQFWKYPTR